MKTRRVKPDGEPIKPLYRCLDIHDMRRGTATKSHLLCK